MTYPATFLTIATGDWLQAGATALAVAGSIFGALYVERKNREAATQEAHDRIVEVVTTLRNDAAAISAGLPDDATKPEHYAKSLQMQKSFNDSLDMYEFVRGDTKVKNLVLWRALRELDAAIAPRNETLKRELRLLQQDGHHTQVFNINRANVMEASLPIDRAAQDVLAVKR